MAGREVRPLYLSVYARHWLRLAGITIGNRAEVSTVVEMNRLTSFAEGSFASDDVVFAGARARGGHRADRGRGRRLPREQRDPPR